MRREAFSSALGVVLMFGGCPKRQTSPRIVYVPAQTPAPQPGPASTPLTGTLRIEEPAPPPSEAAEASPQPTNAPSKPVRRIRRPPRPETAAQPGEADTEPEPEPPAPEVPPLEPRESTQQESVLRRDIQGLQDSVQQHITRLDPARLSNAEKKALEDARTFLAQSSRALDEGDLQRSLNLARKASLVVTAVEQGQ